MSYETFVRVSPGWRELINEVTFASDSRTSIGSVEELKTGLLAVAHAGAGRNFVSAAQTLARRLLVAAMESDAGACETPPIATGVGSERVVQSEAVSVQVTVNGSFGSRAGVAVEVRRTVPFASTTDRRVPPLSDGDASCSVERMATFTD
jgi:hypothetical protein